MIRKAEERDIPRIMELLGQVLQIHADIRPDIFIPGTTKYTADELKELLKNKDYFIVTLKDREGLEKAGILKEQITAPVEEPDNQESWDKYLHWLSFTLNQKLCVLELGVGFAHPQLIRFPFEKTVYFNQKARYIRVSEKFPQLSAEIADRGTAVKENPVTLFAK